jgi:AraC family transcriptional regulator of adaptative response/methylated-DNA-[protein]-cysteine methyltransferase
MEYKTMTVQFNSVLARLTSTKNGASELSVRNFYYRASAYEPPLDFAIARTPDLYLLLAATAHGISWLGIHASRDYLEAELRRQYPCAQIRDDGWPAELAARVVDSLSSATVMDLPIDIRATEFQLEVWRELCAIPRGVTRSYGEIARRIERPYAVRAVGRANGANPTAIIIPCHRAIGTDGSLTGYRWGVEIKRQLLEREGALPQAVRRPAGA